MLHAHWQRILAAWGSTSARVKLNEPIAISRCSAIPILILFVMSLVICILSICGVGLGVLGGLFQLGVTILFLLWMILQLESADATIQTHGVLTQIHQDVEEDETQMINYT